MTRRARPIEERRAERAAVDDPEIVFAAAARFLEARSRSVAEVRRRLTSAGYRPELVDGAVARMVELGFLDDAAFARSWVESRDRAHPRGARALRQELRSKGIADEVVGRVLDERGDGPTALDQAADQGPLDADESAALRLLDRKAALLARSADPRERRQRGYVLLVRNGFDHELSWRLSARLAEPRPGQDGDDGEGSDVRES
jgi:regulatory protein